MPERIVLFVDDERVTLAALQRLVRDEPYRSLFAASGSQALEILESESVSVVVTDMIMPEMDGLETLKAIQEINAADMASPPIGVIMLSAHTQKGADVTIKALEAGAFDFVTKPEGQSPQASVEILRRQLLVKIRYFASRLISSKFSESSKIPLPSQRSASVSSTKVKALVIGVSTGGPRALTTSWLPGDACQETGSLTPRPVR